MELYFVTVVFLSNSYVLPGVWKTVNYQYPQATVRLTRVPVAGDYVSAPHPDTGYSVYHVQWVILGDGDERGTIIGLSP